MSPFYVYKQRGEMSHTHPFVQHKSSLKEKDTMFQAAARRANQRGRGDCFGPLLVTEIAEKDGRGTGGKSGMFKGLLWVVYS